MGLPWPREKTKGALVVVAVVVAVVVVFAVVVVVVVGTVVVVVVVVVGTVVVVVAVVVVVVVVVNPSPPVAPDGPLGEDRSDPADPVAPEGPDGELLASPGPAVGPEEPDGELLSPKGTSGPAVGPEGSLGGGWPLIASNTDNISSVSLATDVILKKFHPATHPTTRGHGPAIALRCPLSMLFPMPTGMTVLPARCMASEAATAARMLASMSSQGSASG